MKNRKHLLSALTIFVLLISPLSLKGLAIFVDADNELQIISEDTEWSGSKLLDGHYYVDEGVVLTVTKGSHLTFKNNASIEIQGKMDVRGTVLSPVVLQKENPGNNGESYLITADGSGELDINNAEISGGGNVYEAVPIGVERSFIKKAYAATFYTGTLNAFGASKLIVQATKFHDNQVAVNAALGNVSDGRVSVTRSSFENNNFDVVNQNNQIHPDFKYNWWGSVNGPNAIKIIVLWIQSFFRTKAELRDPVIIIPGILGSQEKDGVLVMDPILHTYDNLYDSFVAQGYTPNVDLFVFPYDWYQSNVNTAMLLRDRINQITLDRHWPKVDIVA